MIFYVTIYTYYMKHIIKKSALISTALAIGAFFAYQANSRIVLTDLAKENVEALANSEWENGQRISCMSFIISPTPEEFSHGGGYPVAVDCEPCGNLVIAKEASGSNSCTYYKM